MKLFMVIELPTEEYLDHLVDSGFDIEEIIDIDVPFIVGIFNKLKMAKEIAEELAIKNEGKYEYMIERYELNGVYFKNEEEVEKDISESLEKMVKEGIVDYKIGEDGQFYFEVVDDKGIDNESNRNEKNSK